MRFKKPPLIMDKPKLEDFSLSANSVREIIAYNKERYWRVWLIIHILSITTALLVAFCFATSLEERMVIFFAMLTILYTLNYSYVYQFFISRFYKLHPLTPNLKNFIKAHNNYVKYIKNESFKKAEFHSVADELVLDPKPSAAKPGDKLNRRKKHFWSGIHIAIIVIVAILIATIVNSIHLTLSGENQTPPMSLSSSAQYFSSNYFSNYFGPGSGPVGLPGLYGMIACVIALIIIIIVLIKLPKGKDADDYE